MLPIIDGFKAWGLSALISAASLCLLLKTNFWYISLLAAALTVASKYVFRIGHKHIFNPSAFGIVATILLTKNAWLSPGQWGTGAVLFFAIITLGTITVTRVQKLDVSLAFLLTFVGLLFWRQVYVLGWPLDHFVHSISTGGLLLFTFFMISDPRTSPDHPVARIIWAVLIAAVAFYLSAFKFMNSTAIWVLVMAAPLVPVLDKVFKAKLFAWTAAPVPSFALVQRLAASGVARKGIASVLLLTMIAYEAAAFCGFYVSKADGTLKNKTSQVIMVRDGDRNVITMYNDFKGDTKDFAMVVPVPVVLEKKDIKVVNQDIFQVLNDYSKPRLVEYYDQNPCNQVLYEMTMAAPSTSADKAMRMDSGFRLRKEEKVKIEAQYIVGEYDILILSATESAALKTWLDGNGYKIPKGAEEVLEPYIKSNLKFFVVKVNEAELKKLRRANYANEGVDGDFLRPIQISFTSPKFMLPIRLGMANADGDQDMLVYAFTKKGRVEVTNYRTTSMPTGKNIPLFVKENFGTFYGNLFNHQWQREGKAVAMLEYAWDVSPKNFMKCDPCVAEAPSQQHLVQAGVWWLNGGADYNANVYFTRLHVRYNRKTFPQDPTFQLTPNTENFQSRYIVTHPATGDMDCDAGKQYKKDLKQRRADELEMLTYLTGKGYADWDTSNEEDEAKLLNEASYKAVAGAPVEKNGDNPFLIAALSLGGLGVGFGLSRRRG